QRMMEEAAENLEYEQAAKYRNRLWALAHVTADQAISADGVEEADVFAIHSEGGQTCIQVFFFRTGQNWGNRAYFPKADKTLEPPAILASFIAQFYDDKPVPRQILLSCAIEEQDLLAEALGVKAERKVEILTPRRGTKTNLVGHALTNAREALGRKLAETASQAKLLQGLADRFELPRVPQRIEVFDNSHISGTNAVGGMIVAGPEGLMKAQYRKFNIKGQDISAGDDYAMMHEVLSRRFKRVAAAIAAREGAANDAGGEADGGPGGPSGGQTPVIGEPGKDTAIPDLVLVDGGAGQLSVATQLLDEMGLTGAFDVIGVAKGPDRDAGREHFHIPGRTRPVMLEPRDPVLYFVQRLRDEAHRFAIGTHRAKRAKAISANPLDEIPGIGPTRRRALMKHFGSAKSVSRAGVKDLQAVNGISAEMAQKIYDFFHERTG
ncbi:MAG: excinuclease ABC subunit UvrC, partial [Pseudomonadota bacterium]